MEHALNDHEQLRRIVAYGIDKLGVSFRTETAGSPVLQSLENDGFFARKLSNGQSVRHIYVRRSQGGIWADSKANIEPFVAGANHPLPETISVAHELGHAILEAERQAQGTADAFSDEQERVRTRLQSAESIGQGDADLFYGEEHEAWRRAVFVLRELGFIEWGRFASKCRFSLASYERAIRESCNGWTAPSLEWLDLL